MQKSKIHQKQAKIMYFCEIQYPKLNLKYLKHYDSPLKIERRTPQTPSKSTEVG